MVPYVRVPRLEIYRSIRQQYRGRALHRPHLDVMPAFAPPRLRSESTSCQCFTMNDAVAWTMS